MYLCVYLCVVTGVPECSEVLNSFGTGHYFSHHPKRIPRRRKKRGMGWRCTVRTITWVAYVDSVPGVSFDAADTRDRPTGRLHAAEE